MINTFVFPPIFILDLAMFDGEGGGTAETSGESVNGLSILGQMGESGGENNTGAAPEAPTAEDEFAALIGKDGKFREQYQKSVSEAVQKRLSKAKGENEYLQRQLSEQNAVLDIMRQVYGVTELSDLAEKFDNDNAYWDLMGEEMGLPGDKARELTKLKAQQQAFQAQQEAAQRDAAGQQIMADWMRQGDDLKESYPTFDFATETANPAFINMLKAGASVRNAYESLHLEEIKAGVAEKVTKSVTDDIRANGSRPQENGAKNSPPSRAKSVDELTGKDVLEILEYARKNPGKRITFG